MTRRRRGQLVLLAAAVVVTALVPMLLAYAQLTAGVGAGGDVAHTADQRATLADATRTLERSVSDTSRTLAGGTIADRHDAVASRTINHLAQAVEALESSGTNRGVAVSVARNATAAKQWARTACPRGPSRVFGSCVVTDGVVTQTRANTTAVVAVAFDVTVRGSSGTASATVVVRGVRGAVATDSHPDRDAALDRSPDAGSPS